MAINNQIEKLDRVPIVCTDDDFSWYEEPSPLPADRPKLRETVHALYHVPCHCGCVGYLIIEEYPKFRWHLSHFEVGGYVDFRRYTAGPSPLRRHVPMSGDPGVLGGSLNAIPAMSEEEETISPEEVDDYLKELEDWGQGAGILVRPQRPIISIDYWVNQLEELRKYICFKIDHPQDLNRMTGKDRAAFINGVLYHEDRLDMLRMTAHSFDHYWSLYQQFMQNE